MHAQAGDATCGGDSCTGDRTEGNEPMQYRIEQVFALNVAVPWQRQLDQATASCVFLQADNPLSVCTALLAAVQGNTVITLF